MAHMPPRTRERSFFMLKSGLKENLNKILVISDWQVLPVGKRV